MAIHFESCSDWSEKVASAVPGKTLEQVKKYYEILVEDVASIESGRVPLPNYASVANTEDLADGGGHGKKGGSYYGDSTKRGKVHYLNLNGARGLPVLRKNTSDFFKFTLSYHERCYKC